MKQSCIFLIQINSRTTRFAFLVAEKLRYFGYGSIVDLPCFDSHYVGILLDPAFFNAIFVGSVNKARGEEW